MGRFPPLQLALLAFGCSLIFASVFFDRLAAAWEDFLYPNAVHWHDLRIVPVGKQQIVSPAADILVVKDADARLTLFLRPLDNLTPQKLVRDLCRRDRCIRSAAYPEDADRAAATYRINGESLQIVLMRLGNGAIWVEYRGSPEALAGFDTLIQSVSEQLSARRMDGTG